MKKYLKKIKNFLLKAYNKRKLFETLFFDAFNI